MDNSLVITLAGPSGAGKTAVLQAVLDRCPELGRPVTSTTRSPRPGEADGIDYHFVGLGERDPARRAAIFDEAVARGEFVDSNTYSGNRYGLSRAALHDVQKSGRTPVIILDVNGVAALSRQERLFRIFLRAPLRDIERRIRAERPPEEIEARLRVAEEEIREGTSHDFVVDNADGQLESTVDAVVSAIRERLSQERTRPRLAGARM